MLRLTLPATGLTAALALAMVPLALPSVAAEELPPPARSRAMDTPARAALVEAERALRGRAEVPEVRGGHGLTLLLRDLRAAYPDLTPEERRRADRLLLRPDGSTDPENEPVLYEAGAAPANDCETAPTPDSPVCVHWATATGDAPDLTDTDEDGLPDYVESVRDELTYVWDRVVTKGLYEPPRSDLSSTNNGPDGRLDVYLADLGALGYYGYCTSDDPSWQTSNQLSAYCVLDDDYAPEEYGTVQAPLDNMRVTAAHEFFHAVQFGYDVWEDFWLMEGSAAWIEDELYDDVDDNRQYLRHSPLSRPDIPLDWSDEEYLGQYGSWIFLRYLTERLPAKEGTGLPVFMRRVWERSEAPTYEDWGDYSLRAIARELSAQGLSFTRVFQEFGVANRRPARFYDEGAAYSAAPLAGSLKLKNSSPWLIKGRPDHLSNDTVRLVPGRRLKAKSWKLKVEVDLPRRRFGYGVAATVLRRNGKVSSTYVGLSASGDGTVKVPFSRRTVRAVELTMTNASTRFTCWDGTWLTCSGTPKDDGRATKLVVKAMR